MTKADHYIHGVGEKWAHRLALLAEIQRPYSENFLAKANIKPGMRIADVGCGIGAMTDWLAQQVGINGKVFAIDYSKEQLAIAQKSLQTKNLHNINFQALSVYELDSLEEQFDLIYCRSLLNHLARPQKALQLMYDRLKPGGILACEEMIVADFFCYPPSDAFDKHINLMLALTTSRNIDFATGPKLFNWFKQLGCKSVHVKIIQALFETTEQKHHIDLITAENAAGYIQANLATQAEIDGLIKDLQTLAEDNNHLIAAGPVFQTMGRKSDTLP